MFVGLCKGEHHATLLDIGGEVVAVRAVGNEQGGLGRVG